MRDTGGDLKGSGVEIDLRLENGVLTQHPRDACDAASKRSVLSSAAVTAWLRTLLAHLVPVSPSQEPRSRND